MELRRRDGGVVAVDLLGPPDGAPTLFCHGLADSRRSARRLAPVAEERGLRVIAPDRPGTGGTDLRRLDRVSAWVEDAAEILDALDIPEAQLVGVSGGGAFAAACAALLPSRFRRLVLLAPLGPPEWPTGGMAPWQRRSLALGARLPGFGGWFLERLAMLGRCSPPAFFRVVTAELPDADRQALGRQGPREDFLAGYLDAFRQGGAGVRQDLRLLTRAWGFDLGDIRVPTVVHHGAADRTVPVEHARLFASAIAEARLRVHPGHGHFSLPADSARWSNDLLG